MVHTGTKLLMLLVYSRVHFFSDHILVHNSTVLVLVTPLSGEYASPIVLYNFYIIGKYWRG
jgi:hypothetical protein